jgi:hypothetical protein
MGSIDKMKNGNNSPDSKHHNGNGHEGTQLQLGRRGTTIVDLETLDQN